MSPRYFRILFVDRWFQDDVAVIMQTIALPIASLFTLLALAAIPAGFPIIYHKMRHQLRCRMAVGYLGSALLFMSFPIRLKYRQPYRFLRRIDALPHLLLMKSRRMLMTIGHR